MNNVIKLFLQFCFSYLILMVIFSISLIAVYTLNSNSSDSKINTSLHVLQKEGLYPTYGLSFRKIILDNYTDTLMLNTAYSSNTDNIGRSAFFNNREVISKSENDQIKNLAANIQNTTIESVTYERYWHGYLVFLKPLLKVFDYATIRLLITLILLITSLYLLGKIKTLLGWPHVVALSIGFLYVDFLYLGQSIQFFQVFLIGMSSSMIYLQYKHIISIHLLFFITGALTAFFDLLTAPFITLGILLIVTTTIQASLDTKSLLRHYKALAIYLTSWALGYTLLWISKWILVDLFYHANVISDAIGHVINRTVTNPGADFNYVKVIELNLLQLIGYDKRNKIFALVLALLCMVCFIFFKKKNSTIVMQSLYWLPIIVLPYGWYLFAANHSYLHVWYTYRTQFMTVAAGVLFFISCIEWQRILIMRQSILKRTKHRSKKIK